MQKRNLKGYGYMKSIKVLAGALFALAAWTGYGEEASAKPTLRIYTWSDYIAPGVVARFEKEYGCKIVIETFDSNETMFEKLKTGKADYDIAMPSSYLIPAMEENGMIRPLDHKKLPNVRKNFDAHYAGCILDPSFFFSVPYSMTLTGFIYRKDKIGAAPVNSWDVFETAAFKGRLSLLDDIRETIGGGLKALGYSLNSANKAEIEAAVRKVLEWKRNIAKFESEQPEDAVASGDMIVGHGYSSDAIQLMLKDPNIGFALPEEGFTIAFDEMVILSGSKQSNLAHAFINFCYDPDVAAANMTAVCSPMPVAAAFPKLDAKLRQLVVPTAETLHRGEVLRSLDDKPEALKMYNEAWERIKSGK